MLKRLPKLSLKKIKPLYDLPEDYIVTKFYELGYKVTHNSYNNTYNSCCPLCREGKSWGRKKRCYYIPENDNIYCHNCGVSLKPYKWIKEVSGMSDEEIRQDFENHGSVLEYDPNKKETNKPKPHSLPEDSINLFDDLQISYYQDDSVVQSVLEYLKRRRLNTAVNKPDAFFLSKKDYSHKNRLIIPFKDTKGKIIFYQTRKIFDWDDKPDYLSKFGADKSFFGMERIDPSMDSVFIFEGPLDSCFVKNGIAVAGINEGNHKFTHIQLDQLEELKFFNKIWVVDNQWIDKAAREKTLILLEQGETVFIWPEKFKVFKDFNDLCMYCKLDEIKHDFIKKNSQCGKSAVLKFKVLFGKI